MSSPISRIGGFQKVSREAGSEGHDSSPLKGGDARERGATTAAYAGAPRNAKVEEVAKMYERQFLGEMFKAMRSTVHETESPSMAQGIYNSQRDEQYIDAWENQGGVGFANIIYDQIMDRYFGGTAQGRSLKQQGPIPLTNRDIATVSQVKNGVATPVKPSSITAPSSASTVGSIEEKLQSADARVATRAPSLKSTALPGETRTVENTEPMPAPTPARIDTRTMDERLEAKEYFPTSATARDYVPRENVEPSAPTKLESASPRETKTQTQYADALTRSSMTPAQNASLQIEVRPSPTGAPAKIQAPWDATVSQVTKLDGGRTAVTLEHGQGLRSTLVFDGVLSASATSGQKIPRGDSIGTLNQDAKSFLWNLATPATNGVQGQSQIE